MEPKYMPITKCFDCPWCHTVDTDERVVCKLMPPVEWHTDGWGKQRPVYVSLGIDREQAVHPRCPLRSTLLTLHVPEERKQGTMPSSHFADWQPNKPGKPYDIRLVAFGMGRDVAKSFDPESGESVLAPVVGSDYIELTLEVSDGAVAARKKLTLAATPDTRAVLNAVSELVGMLSNTKEAP